MAVRTICVMPRKWSARGYQFCEGAKMTMLRMPAERCWIKKDHRRCHHHKTTARPSPLPLLPPFPLFPPYPLLLYTPYYPPTLLCRVCVLVVVVVFYYILFIYTYLCYIAAYIIIYPCLYYIATYIILYDNIYYITHKYVL
nr:MAG TPA: hypothetical protein [Caudoviricetes sp.]